VGEGWKDSGEKQGRCWGKGEEDLLRIHRRGEVRERAREKRGVRGGRMKQWTESLNLELEF
jgi:hypothetical protein